jgi:hypothetical protein
MGDIKREGNALSEEQIRSFYQHKIYPNSHVPFAFKYLKDVINSTDLPEVCFIHTDQKQDEVNNGYNNHWLVLIYDQLFDSYGYQSQYNLGAEFKETVKFVNLHPKRIQSFGTVVCGEYCLNFANYYFTERTAEGSENVGSDYTKINGYTTNTAANDEKVLQWYKEGASHTSGDAV